MAYLHPFQGGDAGSNPAGVTIFANDLAVSPVVFGKFSVISGAAKMAVLCGYAIVSYGGFPTLSK